MPDEYLPRPLSDKAKGKQRAVDPVEDERNHLANGSSSRPQEPLSRPLTIRFTEGVHDLVLDVHDKETVKHVKDRIRVQRPSLQNRRLRLIHSGRLLTDGTFIYGWLSALEGRQRRANGQDEDAGAEADVPVSSTSTTWLHCSIGAEMAAEEEEDATKPLEQVKPLRGLDRLLNAGFTEDEIGTIRRQFRTSRGLDDNPAPLDDEYDEHARALEEQWIDDLDGATGPVDGSLDDGDGLYTTLLQGVTTGFFFGLLPFFYMRQTRPAAFFSDDYDAMEHIPSVVYSKRMQMALVIGLIVNILIGILKYLS